MNVPQLATGLILAALPGLFSAYLFFVHGRTTLALTLLVVSSFLLHLVMAAADPFLHPWDERFHALVAKHMMTEPFRPMLRLDPILPYDPEAWCCNHIWVHKQPLFLWQMALSMKVFGVSEVAVRLPSAVMGALGTLLVYGIGRYWTKSREAAFIAAVWFGFSRYHLELTSGRYSLDHNDVAFAFYVTASIWAFTRYLSTGRSWRWAIAAGVFVGCAVLNKWLTGLLVFGGWGLHLLGSPARSEVRAWAQLGTAALVAVTVFLPWQLYILQAFPEESAIMYAHNRRHIFEALDGHRGDAWYHLLHLPLLYERLLFAFGVVGMVWIWWDRRIDKALTVAYVAMVVVLYGFFTLVATRMPAFTFPVHALIWSLIGYGAYRLTVWLSIRTRVSSTTALLVLTLAGALYSLDPHYLLDYRSPNNARRNAEIHNATIMRELDTAPLKGRVIINLKSMEDAELMFYQDVNAYHFFFEEAEFDSLVRAGYKFAAFTDHQKPLLRKYITESDAVIIIDQKFR